MGCARDDLVRRHAVVLVPNHDVLHSNPVAVNASPSAPRFGCFYDLLIGRTLNRVPSLELFLVGPPGFEPGTSCTPSKRASQAAPRPDAPV